MAQRLHLLQRQLEEQNAITISGDEEPTDQELLGLLMEFEQMLTHRDVDTVIKQLHGHLILRKPDGTLMQESELTA